MSWVSDEKIHEVFAGFDTDKSGVLEKKELQNALFLLGIDLTEEELQGTYCLDGDPDSFTEEEFTKLIRENIGDVNFMERLSESLLEFDEDGSQVISRDKLKEILTMRGSCPVDDDEADNILDQIPFDENGCVDPKVLAEIVYEAHEGGKTTEGQEDS